VVLDIVINHLCDRNTHYLTDQIPDASQVDLSVVKLWANSRLKPASDSFPYTRFPSPENWSRNTVYSILVDRFNNGDPSNDQFNIPDVQKQNQFNKDM